MAARDDLKLLMDNVQVVRDVQSAQQSSIARMEVMLVRVEEWTKDLRGDLGQESIPTRITRLEEIVRNQGTDVRTLEDKMGKVETITWKMWGAIAASAGGALAGGAALIRSFTQ